MLTRRDVLRAGWGSGLARLATASPAATSVLTGADREFLAAQARKLIQMSRWPPGRSLGKWTNTTGCVVYVPSGNMGYPAMWVRDAVMMYGTGFVPASDIEDCIRLVAYATQGASRWSVRPGADVPPYSVPDHVLFDKRSCFYPGACDGGANQGGGKVGRYPPLDDAFYFIEAVYEHWKLTGKTSLFLGEVETRTGRMLLHELCGKVYAQTPADPATSLVAAGDTATENAKDWGFCDTVFKSGKLLFPSVLKYRAALQMAEVCGAAGLTKQAGQYTAGAQRIRRGIPAAFFHPAPGGDGWLHSATGVGNQPDVWGSAFAVWAGVVDGKVADAVARALRRAYRDRTAVRNGFVRQILTTDRTNNGFWQECHWQRGEYQNGGYWGVPAGWYVAALNRVDPEAAAALLSEYISFLRKETDAAGISMAWECVSPDSGKKRNNYYVATIALPYAALLA